MYSFVLSPVCPRRCCCVSSNNKELGGYQFLEESEKTVLLSGRRELCLTRCAPCPPRQQTSDLKEKIDLVRDFAARISKALGTRASQLPVPGHGNFYDPFS
jgi:hypothetical protein